jgi:spermidine synthase
VLYTKLKIQGNETYLKVKELLYHEHSNYQEITVAEYPIIGKALILDDELQSCSQDFEAYHNALIVPYEPANHERVLVIGAGEGLVTDLLLRSSWKHIDAVELDPSIPLTSDKCLSDWNNHIYKRTDEFNLIIGDGLTHLKGIPDQYYSYVIFDLNSSAILQNQHEWLFEIYRCLLPNGMLSAQDGAIQDNSYLYHPAKEIFQTEPILRQVQSWRFLHISKNNS